MIKRKSMKIHWKDGSDPLWIESYSNITYPSGVLSIRGYKFDHESPSTFLVYEREVKYIDKWEWALDLGYKNHPDED